MRNSKLLLEALAGRLIYTVQLILIYRTEGGWLKMTFNFAPDHFFPVKRSGISGNTIASAHLTDQTGIS